MCKIPTLFGAFVRVGFIKSLNLSLERNAEQNRNF